MRLPGQGVVLKDDEAESKKKIEDAFSTAGLKVPALYEVLANLKIDKARAQKIVTLLLRDKVLIKISDELVFHRTALEQLRRLVATQKTKISKDGCRDLQRADRRQPQVRHPPSGILRPGACDEACRRRPRNPLTRIAKLLPFAPVSAASESRTVFNYAITKFPDYSIPSDFFFREFHFQPQRVGKSIR